MRMLSFAAVVLLAVASGCNQTRHEPPHGARHAAVPKYVSGAELAKRYQNLETPAPKMMPSAVPPEFLAGTWVPSGWCGDATQGALAYKVCEPDSPTDVAREEWTYDPTKGELGWSAVAYQFPERNEGQLPGKNLSGKGYTRLSFFARNRAGTAHMIFKSGGHTAPTGVPYPASYQATTGMVTVGPTWKLISIPLNDLDLSNIPAALTVVFTKQMAPRGCVLQLRDIAFRGPNDWVEDYTITPSTCNQETIMHTTLNGTNGKRPHNSNGASRAIITIGGGFSSAASFARDFGADASVALDVAAEQRKIKPADGLAKIVLAEGDTFAELAAQGSDALRRLATSRTGVNVGDGLGQLRELGYIVARKLVTAPGFQATMQSAVFHPMMLNHNCVLDTVLLDFFVGACGGVGGPGSIPVAQGITDLILGSTNAPVRANFTLLGPLTFLGLGERIIKNAAACVAQVLAHAVCAPRAPREVRCLSLVDAPPCGDDMALRAMYVAQLSQAVTAKKVQERLELCGPNRAIDTPLGVVTILRAGWFQRITPERIAAEAADAYLPELERLLRTPAKSGAVVGLQVEFMNASTKIACASKALGEKLRAAKGSEPAQFAAAWTQVEFVHEGASVSATIRGRKVRNLATHLESLASEPSASVEATQEKLTILASMHVSLAHLLREHALQIEALERERQPALEAWQEVRRLFFPSSVFQSLRAMVADLNHAAVRFENAIDILQETGGKIARLNAEVEILQRLASQVEQVLTLQRKRLGRVARLLASIQPAGASTQNFVELVPVDAVFDRLRQMALQERDEPEELITLLGSTAARVTLHGLVEITQSHESTPTGIALQLIKGESAVDGPYWGSEKPTSMKEHKIIVLPPVAPILEESLRNEVRCQAGDMEVVCADTCRAGVNVLRLDVYHPRTWDHVFTRLLRRGLAGIDRDSLPLYFPGDADCLAKLNALPDVPGAKL